MLAIVRRSAFLGCLTLLFLSACHSGDSSSPSTDSSGKVVVTPFISISGSVTAMSGTRQTLGIPFSVTESGTLSNLIVTGLAELPAGWSGPATFTCASVGTGNGCMLGLTFSPTGATAGTLTLHYTYSDGTGATQSGSVTIPYASTTDNNVVGTASPSGQVVATASSGSQSVAVTFNTDDGNPATAVTLTDDLTQLPAGWSSTATTFSCANVSTGNGCQLPLTYAPTGAGSGVLSLSFSYLDDSGTAKNGTVSIPYSTTTNNNVVATSAPSGQVNAIVAAGSRPVILTFTTDDGGPATGLAVTTSLAALPAGWTSGVSTLTCATVSTGNGCQLTLNYAPSAVGTGTLEIAYSYKSNSGVAKTGTASIPYAATQHDNVAGGVSPSGQVDAVVNSGSQTVQVTFDTDDGNVATSLTLASPLNALPSGWSSTAQSFSCSNVSTGSGCQLSLAYAPSTVATGTLTLVFVYVDNAGSQKAGTVSIPYAATIHDTVTGTVAPSGPLNVLVNTSQSVNVTFTTDDGRAATDLSIASSVLSSLPPGWSGPGGGFSCATVSTGTNCQLGLTLAPSAAGSGSVSLPYIYTDNAGSRKTGTVNIPYIASVHNNIVATASPSATVAAYVGITQPVTVTFNTDDANPASSLSVTGLSTLPTDWSSSVGTFSCANVASTGTACQLTLTYQPTSAASGTVHLNFSYTDNSGTGKTGTIAIAYTSTVRHAYIDSVTSGPYVCPINVDGTLGGCTDMMLGANLWDMAFNGNFVYLSNIQDNNIMICTVAADATFTNCTSGGNNLSAPAQLAIQGSHLYVASTSGGATVCTIDASSGALSNCTATGPVSISSDIAVVGNYAYVGDPIGICPIDAMTGLLGNCTSTSQSGIFELASANGYLYTGLIAGGVGVCPIAADGSITTCSTSPIATGVNFVAGITVDGTRAYVSASNSITGQYDVYVCSVDPADGSLSNCTVSDGGANPLLLLHVVIH